MTVTIHVPPEKEEALKAQAQALGMSVEQWLLRLAEREAGEPGHSGKQFENLSDLLLASPFAGANLSLERCQDYPRSIGVQQAQWPQSRRKAMA
jgi:hypothetical protein